VRYLLDTNVLSEARKPVPRRDPRFHEWIQSVAAEDAAISVITLGEVLAGVLRLERKDTAQGALLRRWYVEDVLGEFADRTLPVTRQIAELEARLQVPDQRPKAGALLAATAVSHHLVLVTRNVADFAGTGVAWLNPWTGESGDSFRAK